MSKTISIIRIAIILLTALVAFFAIFAGPVDDTPAWEVEFIISKAIGFGLAYLTYRLYNRWSDDPLISRYEKWSREQSADL